MKKLEFGYKALLPIALVITLMGSSLHAQNTKEVVTDTTEISFGRKTITIVKDSLEKKDIHIATKVVCDTCSHSDGKEEFKRVKTSLLGIDLGANFFTYNGDFNLPAGHDDYEIQPLRSTHVGLHLLPTHFNFGKEGKVSILTAITFDNNRYQFNNNVRPVAELDSLVMLTDSINLLKNKLVTWYAQVPLMLSFQTNPLEEKKNFHISVGGYAGLFIYAKFKEKSVERGKVNFDDDYNLNRFRYGVTARIGYRNIELYANYQLSSLFNDNEGPTLNPFNVGIALTGFL